MGFFTSILALIGLVVVVIFLFSFEEGRHERQKIASLMRRDSPKVQKIIRDYNEDVKNGNKKYSESELEKLILKFTSDKLEQARFLKDKNDRENEYQESQKKSLEMDPETGFTQREYDIEMETSRFTIFHYFQDNRVLSKSDLFASIGYSIFADEELEDMNESQAERFFKLNESDIKEELNKLIKIGYIEVCENNSNYFKVGYALRAGFSFNDKHDFRPSWESYLIENNINLKPLPY
ncbi:hypothetical protein [Flavobacterium caeni]|uniref:Uncharacterized protein n=1 Tax=Flavobacterium caeni TaxID=490189 RepID=A0A1G5KPM8_9FLAO|nr:hypothetical protein [Flavobacterium caeni]SCZ02545.1 hypothetical protein SAMN02927903_03411 [Flavobacterium caeni]